MLRPGSTHVVADGTYGEGSAAFHEGDTYNPVDPEALPDRPQGAGFTDVEVRLNELGRVCTARAGNA